MDCIYLQVSIQNSITAIRFSKRMAVLLDICSKRSCILFFLCQCAKMCRTACKRRYETTIKGHHLEKVVAFLYG